MSEHAPLTPAEAARTLWQIGLDITAKTDELIAKRKTYPGLVKERRLAYAREFLSTEGTLDYRKQRAEKAAADAKFNAEVCDSRTIFVELC